LTTALPHSGCPHHGYVAPSAFDPHEAETVRGRAPRGRMVCLLVLRAGRREPGPHRRGSLGEPPGGPGDLPRGAGRRPPRGALPPHTGRGRAWPSSPSCPPVISSRPSGRRASLSSANGEPHQGCGSPDVDQRSRLGGRGRRHRTTVTKLAPTLRKDPRDLEAILEHEGVVARVVTGPTHLDDPQLALHPELPLGRHPEVDDPVDKVLLLVRRERGHPGFRHAMSVRGELPEEERRRAEPAEPLDELEELPPDVLELR